MRLNAPALHAGQPLTSRQHTRAPPTSHFPPMPLAPPPLCLSPPSTSFNFKPQLLQIETTHAPYLSIATPRQLRPSHQQ